MDRPHIEATATQFFVRRLGFCVMQGQGSLVLGFIGAYPKGDAPKDTTVADHSYLRKGTTRLWHNELSHFPFRGVQGNLLNVNRQRIIMILVLVVYFSCVALVRLWYHTGAGIPSSSPWSVVFFVSVVGCRSFEIPLNLPGDASLISQRRTDVRDDICDRSGDDAAINFLSCNNTTGMMMIPIVVVDFDSPSLLRLLRTSSHPCHPIGHERRKCRLGLVPTSQQ